MTTLIHPMFAANAFQFAIEKATPEGKTTIGVLLLLSLFSWTIIITKFRQLYIARKAAKKFFAAYNATRDPLDIKKRGEEFDGAPAYQLYYPRRGGIGLPIEKQSGDRESGETTRISRQRSFEAVKVVLEEAAARAGDVAGERHDCFVHRGGRRAVHRIAGHGLGRDVHVRGHRRGATRRA